MKLLLVRHGPAVDRRAWGARGRDDRRRPLTGAGAARTREAAAGLARLVDPPDVVASSPYVRALETARIVSDAFAAGRARREPITPSGPGVVEALAHDADPRALRPWLVRRVDQPLVALVGHEPQLSRLASWLLTGDPRSILQIKKAGACLLDLGDEPHPGSARLLWLLAPSALRRLGRPR